MQRSGNKAKPYQVRQVRAIITRHGLGEARMMHKYEIIIYWSDVDQVFVAEVPELPGCAAHGDTPEAALPECGEAVTLWIATAEEMGRPIPERAGGFVWREGHGLLRWAGIPGAPWDVCGGFAGTRIGEQGVGHRGQRAGAEVPDSGKAGRSSG